VPLPKPNPGESQKDFLNRCMGDEVMVSEFEDEAQRFAVCVNLWKEAGREMDRNFIYSEEELRDMEARFVSSPRNKYGTHSSVGFKGNYAAAWRCHFSQVNGGRVDPESCGPIQGTIRRCEMIAGSLKEPCNLPKAENIPPRSGPKSPLKCTFPDKPADYGLDDWADPAEDGLTQEDIQLSCKDLAIIKRMAVAELKRRIADREEEQKFLGIEDMEVELFFGDYEVRSLPSSELRVLRREDGGPGTLIGSPGIPYNSWSEDLGGFVERVLPGAVRYEGFDVVCCRDHEDHLVLGRLSNGTLRLSEGKKGLNYECDLPDVSYAHDLVKLVERGDVRGSSFRFTVLRDEWIPARGSSPARREIHELQLFELGPVTMPAYPQTVVGLRSLLRKVGIDTDRLGIAVRRVRSGDPTGEDIDVITKTIASLRQLLPAPRQGAEGPIAEAQGRLELARKRLELLINY